MVLYNLSNVTAANNTLQILHAVNVDLTGQMFSIMVILLIFVVMIVAFSRQIEPQGAVLTAGFLTSIITILLWLAGFAPFQAVIYMVVITTIAMGATIIMS